MKYAIVQTSGKQFFLRPNRWCDVDLIKKGKLGELISLNKILLFKKNLEVQLGKPFLEESTISGRMVQAVKGPKMLVLKTKPKKHYTRAKGHRQNYSRIELIT